MRKFSLSRKAKLDIASFFLLLLLCFSAFNIIRSWTWSSFIPLLFIIYAAGFIIAELTIHRSKVPTLAAGFIARRKIAQIVSREAAKSALKRTDKAYKIVDLGSGRGELTRYLARHVPHAEVTGIEIAPLPHAQANFIKRFFGLSNVFYERLDFTNYDCAKADAVVMYLDYTLTHAMGEKLYKELQKGSIVVTVLFQLRGAWTPAEVLNFRTPFKETIYLYRKE